MKGKVAAIGLVLAVAGTAAAVAFGVIVPPITVAQKDTAGTLSIVGIDGGDTAAGQTISVLSFSLGVSKAGSTDNAELHELSITKLIDKASPNLFLACATGHPIQRLTLVLNRPGATAGTPPLMTYRLDNVLVSSDTHTGSGSDRALEHVTFQYTRIDQTYITSDGETVETGFDSNPA